MLLAFQKVRSSLPTAGGAYGPAKDPDSEPRRGRAPDRRGLSSFPAVAHGRDGGLKPEGRHFRTARIAFPWTDMLQMHPVEWPAQPATPCSRTAWCLRPVTRRFLHAPTNNPERHLCRNESPQILPPCALTVAANFFTLSGRADPWTGNADPQHALPLQALKFPRRY